MLSLGGYAGYKYLVVAAAVSVWWLGMALRGYKVADDRIWARKLFGFSIIAITALSVMMSVDLWYRTRIRCWLLCGNKTSLLKRCYGTFFIV
ncbi:protoheme IX farnesyltransferase [Escherichia coli]|uniref:Protoheme IX farnesyltransferase n=1 Tax=Escherichia coli TaxID=562 RepID=A0A376U4Y2_ECOLX|nr:protoheme IX farnesyltransferase [Escherichia coli]